MHFEDIYDIFWSSDTHFNHKRILDYQPNRLYSSVDEMNDGLIDAWFLASLTGPRAATAEQLAAALGEGKGQAQRFDDVSAAYQAALAASSPDDMVIVFGSFYTVADILAGTAS